MPRPKDPRSEDPPLGITKASQNTEAWSSLLGRAYGDLDPTNPVFAEDRQLSPCHHLQTGDIFYGNVEEDQAEHMLIAFNLQWEAIKLYAIAEGAESLVGVADHPQYLDSELEWIGRPLPTIWEMLDSWGP